MLWLAVVLGAFIGAPLRFAAERATLARYGPRWPIGTFSVNMAGSLILGTLTGVLAGVTDNLEGWKLASAFIGMGFCGSLTTFSSWTVQISELTKGPQHWRGSAYAIVSIALGLTLATIGYVLGFAFTG